jgi:8-oxo-dGTP pyrophosphatase MutT (NUDIX family)
MERHFTVTGFVVEDDRTLLHWHPTLAIWLPPGGHIDPNEDPVEAVVREVREETGMLTEVVWSDPPYAFRNVRQLPRPLWVIVADVPDGPHQHIDFCYAVREVRGSERSATDYEHGFIWVSEEELRRGDPLPVPARGNAHVHVPDDVSEIGIAAIRLVRRAGESASPPR